MFTGGATNIYLLGGEVRSNSYLNREIGHGQNRLHYFHIIYVCIIGFGRVHRLVNQPQQRQKQ